MPEQQKFPDVVSYDWPGGMASVAGGTRSEIKLDRPWQSELNVDPATCPFCTEPQAELKRFDEGGGWRLIDNAFTPYHLNGGVHKMLIPASCWTAEEMRYLGGSDRISCALRLIQAELNQYRDKTIFVNVHVNYLAGQNVMHLHWHIVQYLFDQDFDPAMTAELQHLYTKDPRISKLVFCENAQAFVGVGGVWAGQCFIVPHPERPVVLLPDLADLIAKTVSRFNDKFRSKQGIAPDFNISLAWDGKSFACGAYTPVLNHRGGAENLVMYQPKKMGGKNCRMTMPWTHEKTLERLTS